MSIIKQTIKGRSVNSLSIVATTADLADLQALLEGEVTTYETKSTGGTSSPYPTDLNTKKYSVGDKATGLSGSFTIKHIKPTADINDVENVVINAFDANSETTVKSDRCSMFYDANKRYGA